MNPIDSFPEKAPLRAVLPAFTPDTQSRLVQWACTQPGALPWLLVRSAEYWDAASPALNTCDEWHRSVEATCALELLRWRTATTSDRMAVDHLKTPLAR
jgi:hypothetical protein